MANMAYTPLALANTFVAKYGDGHGIDHMKLQKLAFYAYGWWLAYNPDPILTEGPEVWRYGPVFSSLYNVLCTHRMVPVKEPQKAVYTDLDWVFDRNHDCSNGIQESRPDPGHASIYHRVHHYDSVNFWFLAIGRSIFI